MKKSTWLLLGAVVVIAYLLWRWSKTPQIIPITQGGGGFNEGRPL